MFVFPFRQCNERYHRNKGGKNENTSNFFVLLVLLIIGCSSSANSAADVKLGEAFQLGYGQSVTLTQNGLTITFKALSNESRCPKGAACPWKGNARVVISITGKDISLNTNLKPKEASYSGHKIKLLDVLPYPKLHEHHNPESYSISLIITKE